MPRRVRNIQTVFISHHSKPIIYMIIKMNKEFLRWSSFLGLLLQYFRQKPSNDKIAKVTLTLWTACLPDCRPKWLTACLPARLFLFFKKKSSLLTFLNIYTSSDLLILTSPTTLGMCMFLGLVAHLPAGTVVYLFIYQSKSLETSLYYYYYYCHFIFYYIYSGWIFIEIFDDE